MKKLLSVVVCLALAVAMTATAFAEIKRGSRGEDVRELQQRLIDLGFLDDVADGSFGPKTEAALAAFQEANGLEPDGEATIQVINLLFSDEIVDVGGTAPAQEAGANLISVKEYGCALDSGTLNYTVILHNDSADSVVLLPAFRIEGWDERGELAGSVEETLSAIYPGQDYAFTGTAYACDRLPAQLDVTVLQPDASAVVPVTALKQQAYAPLEIRDASRTEDRFSGQIYNPNDYDLDAVLVMVLFRDAFGKLGGGRITALGALQAGGSAPFDISGDAGFATDAYEIVAQGLLLNPMT